MSVNKVILVGRAGKDPEVKTTKDGKKVAAFSLATDDYQKDASGNKKTQWHNITVWDPIVNVVEQYVKKGTEMYIEGRISYEEFNNKEGNKVNYTRITATSLQFVGSKKDSAASSTEDNNDAATPPAAKPAVTKPAATKAPATKEPVQETVSATDDTDLPF